MLKKVLTFAAGVLLGQYVANNYYYKKGSKALIKSYEEELETYKKDSKTSETEKES